MDDEFEANEVGYTWMWRKCCLNRVKEAFQMRNCAGSKITATEFNWCFTRDTGGLTVAGKARSMIRKGGLIYSQFYTMNKLQFDATKRFPWDDEDDTMAMMAVDSVYREALRSTVGVEAIDMKACRRSYNHCGRRFMLGVRVNDARSWGAREEHRMSLALLMSVNAELQSRGNPEIRRRETRTQFYVHRTQIVNRFIESVTLPLARWYQEVLGTAPEGMLGIDRQKLAILQCFLLKNSYGSSLLCRHPILWDKRTRREENGGHEGLGLGLKSVIQMYGFGWLPKEMFDWGTNNFAAGVADQFPFPIRTLEKRYQSRRGERAIMLDILQDMDQVIGRIKISGDNEEGRARRVHLLRWLATRVMRQYHQDLWDALYKSPFEFKGKESERERQRQEGLEEEEMNSGDDEEARPKKKARITKKNAKVVRKTWKEPPALTYASVSAELEEEPLPVGIGKLYFNRRDFFRLIFQSDDDGIKGQGWQNKPYLHALQTIKVHLNSEDHRFVMCLLERLFNETCHCVANISRDRWLVNSGQSKFKPGWIAFDEKGDRIDCSSFKRFRAKQMGSSWREGRSMHDDIYWSMAVDEVTSRE
jgi:hypothetical protein